MIPGMAILLVFQLAGEVLARAAHLPLPGPVVGLVLMLGALALAPPIATRVEPAADGLLGNLSLLFVPAGVGVVQYFSLLAAEWLPIGAALLIGTSVTLAVTGAMMRATTGRGEAAS